MENAYFIIDFDSTFVSVEGLEELAKEMLSGNSRRDEILSEIKRLTDAGMVGKIAFDESLAKRLSLLSLNQKAIDTVAQSIQKRVTKSLLRNKAFFRQYADRIYIISGGFTELILPVAAKFGIAPNHIFANTFVFDKKGIFKGIDRKNPLARDQGKPEVVKSLKLKGNVYVIGDGVTDLRIKQALHEVTFVAFTENVTRDVVIKGADIVASNFDELLFKLQLPRKISYPKTKIKVLLLETINESAVRAFTKEGYHVEALATSPTKDELLSKIADVQILGIRSRTHIDKEVLDKANHLLAIGAFCIGTEQIDLSEATGRGIAVFNAPYSNTRSVVELTIGEIIMLARGTFRKSNQLHEGIWDKSAAGAYEIRGKTLGIVGYGNIGSQLSVVAEALGMHVNFYDTVEKLALGNAKRMRSLSELLRTSDVVTIHVDGRAENVNLIGEKEFSRMKDGVLFINNARGKLVDNNALVKYLKNGKVAGAALDVFPKEPKGKDEAFISALRGLPNVILTPHIGGSTKEAQENIGAFVSEKIIAYINSGSTSLSVSLPNIQLPNLKHTHRLLHIHMNAPGVLAKINSLLAEYNINIEGQYLKTNESVGYVITDVNKKYNQNVLHALRSVEGTIKLRVLY